MPRGRKPRTWVKLDCEGILRGSVNYLLDLEGQAIWVKMIALSEVSGGRAGFIEDNNQGGLPLEYIAHELHCSVEQLEKVLDVMQKDGAINRNGTGSIELVNFQLYQFNEYDRQKGYRETSKEAEKLAEATGDKKKKPYGEFKNVLLTDAEVEKLNERFGKDGTTQRIEKLSLAVESKGYKYKSHYATILNWDRKDNPTDSKSPKYGHMVER